MPTIIIFDADVYITLAQHPANLGAIEAIGNSLTQVDAAFELVVPECVATAYHREKGKAADRFSNSLRSAIKNFRHLANPLSEPERVGTLANELNERIDSLQTKVPEIVGRVDHLISLGRTVSHDDSAWALAAKRFRDSRPPGQRTERSSITDCLIWQVAIAEAARNRLIFCSNNKADFSDPKHDEKLHPHLRAELGEAKYCYHSLEGFLKNHLPSKPRVVTDYSVRCFYCGSFTEPGLISRPSQYGGWSAQRFCSNCGKYSDLGELPDE